MPARHPRLLLVAYQCGPGMGSVSQIGWEWYARLCRQTSVTLVTHVRNRSALAAAGAPLGDSDIIYIDTEWFAGPLYRMARRLFPRSEHASFLVASLDYFPFESAALRVLLPQRERWDVVHRVTPVSASAATRLHRLGLPVVLGPYNCNLPPNPAFREYLNREDSAWLYPLRALGRLPEWLWGGHRHAACILAANTATRTQFVGVPPERVQAMCENGVEFSRFKATPWPPAPAADRPLRVLFVGRLVPFKALPLLLEAMSRLPPGAVHLDVAGDGAMRAEWEKHSQTLGLQDVVCFHGNLPLDAVARLMAQCHVFCLPSVRESGGAVLLEAMACARPVIAVDFGGPADIVDASVGRLLPNAGWQGVTEALAEALRDVIAAPEAWRRRGEEGRRKVQREFGWEAKTASVLALYDKISEDTKDTAPARIPCT